MARTIVMQDLVTVSIDAANPARSVTQPEDDWVDLAPYQDLLIVTYICEQGFQVAGGGAAGTLFFEGSPVKEEAAFQQFNLGSVAANAVPSTWSNPVTAHLISGTPFFRWLRWRIVGGIANGAATWTFRVLLSVNPAPS